MTLMARPFSPRLGRDDRIGEAGFEGSLIRTRPVTAEGVSQGRRTGYNPIRGGRPIREVVMDPKALPFDAETMLQGLRSWVETESPTWDAVAVNRAMDLA